MKYKAPAVHQAIEVLELLIRSGPLSLEQITKRTGFSKATILRLLDTMTLHAWVIKRSVDKTYEALIVVRQKNDVALYLEERIQIVLDQLCTETGLTVEWYQMRDKYSEIVQRCEPIDSAVSIRANIGFRRRYASELEAVNRVAMASGSVDCRTNESNGGYIAYKSGQYLNILLSEALEQVAQVSDDLMTYDHEWNNNGIRRHAIGIMSSHCNISGILAIATSYTPNADMEIDYINTQLQLAGEKLSKLF